MRGRTFTSLGPAALITSIGLFGVLWGWAVYPGPRGTDQFWYAGYVGQFEIHGFPCTNYVGPPAWGQAYPPAPVHHIPALYPALLAGMIGASSFVSWMIVNLALVGVGGLGFFLACRCSRLKSIAHWLTAAALLLPITFWFAANALAEAGLMASGGLMAVGLALRAKARWNSGNTLLLMGALLASLTRPNHQVMLLGLMALTILGTPSRSARRTAIVLCALASASFLGRKILLTSQPGLGGIGSMMMTGAPGMPKGNMLPFFATAPIPVDYSRWLVKVVDSVLEPSLIVPSVCMIAAIIWWYRKPITRVTRDDLVFVVLAVFTMLLTAALFQYQFRYWSCLYLPLLFVFLRCAPAYRFTTSRYFGPVAALVTGGLALACVVLSLKVHRDAIRATEEQASIRRLASEHLLADESVLVLNTWGIPFSYALPEVRVAVGHTELQSEEQIANAIEELSIGVLVIPKNHPGPIPSVSQFAPLALAPNDPLSGYGDIWVRVRP